MIYAEKAGKQLQNTRWIYWNITEKSITETV